jgi:hypothetical protein
MTKTDKDLHYENGELKKNDEGLTTYEEQICFLYSMDDECKGDKVKTLLRSNYSPWVSNGTPIEQLTRVATSIFNRKAVKKKLTVLLRDRADTLLYDRTTIQKYYKEIISYCLEDPRTDEQKDVQSEDYKEWKPDIKNGKATVDSMAKTLGMFDEKVEAVTGEDASVLAKKAFALNIKRLDGEKSGQVIAFEKKVS